MKSGKPKIVLTYPLPKEVIQRDLKPHAQVQIVDSPAKLSAALHTADGWITRVSDPVNDRILKAAPRLKVIGNCAVGYDNIDLTACLKRKVRVVNTPKVLNRATAELTLALLLAAARRMPEGDSLCRTGKFKGWHPQMLLGLELKGRTAVLVGRGRIGTETAKLFRAIGLKIEWITRQDRSQEILKKLKRAQILSIHLSLNPTTRHWLNRTRLSVLPPDAIVINTTRGPVVDEKALIQALQKRRIFAAGLDVYENEPHIPVQLRMLPNVVLMPHLGSATRETRLAMARLAVSGVLGILSGKHPWNEVKSKR